jgi:hypothetical protein
MSIVFCSFALAFFTQRNTGMGRRAVDLTVEELAALGAEAARAAVQEAQNADLVLTGVIDSYDSAGQPASSLSQLHPSGVLTLVDEREGREAAVDSVTTKPARGGTVD